MRLKTGVSLEFKNWKTVSNRAANKSLEREKPLSTKKTNKTPLIFTFSKNEFS